MGIVQQVADMTVGALSEGAVFNKMPWLPTSEALVKDPVEVHIGRDQLDPPVKGVAGEFHPRARGKEGGATEEFDIVATLEAHGGRRMESNKWRRGQRSYTCRKGMTNLSQR